MKPEPTHTAKPSSKLRFRPKTRKIAELLLYLSFKKPQVDHYTACKLVYLADRLHLNRHGRPIVGDAHNAMPWGPVACVAYDLLKQVPAAMKDAGLEVLPFETRQLDKIIVIGAPKRAVDKNFFSVSDLKAFDEVVAEFGDLSFGELHNLTKEHFAYKNAWENKPEHRKRMPMSYDDMMDESAAKADYIDDIAPLSHKM